MSIGLDIEIGGDLQAEDIDERLQWWINHWPSSHLPFEGDLHGYPCEEAYTAQMCLCKLLSKLIGNNFFDRFGP